jgi:hypothetical protein
MGARSGEGLVRSAKRFAGVVVLSLTVLACTAGVAHAASPLAAAESSDTIPPSTTSQVLTHYPTSPATIVLTVNGDLGGSGLASILFSIDGGLVQTGLAREPGGYYVYPAFARVIVSAEGSHTIEYWATDFAGNEEPHHVQQFWIGAGAEPGPAGGINIKSTLYSSVRMGGKPFILSGNVWPTTWVGQTIRVEVKKPGKTYWSYSSYRTVYGQGPFACWWYRYTPVTGMTPGYYYFRAVMPSREGYPPQFSGIVRVNITR